MPSAAVPLTVNEAAVVCPLVMLQAALVIMLAPGLLVIEAPVQVSPVLNPTPDTETAVPWGPMEGLRTIVGEVVVTVNVA